MMTSLIAISIASLLLISSTSKSQSEKGIDVRPRFSKVLDERVQARANRLGLTFAESVRHYTVLGMEAEDFLAGNSPEIGNIDTIRPSSSRRQRLVIMVDSDLTPHVKDNPCGLSASSYVSDLIRKDIVARKNKHGKQQ